eukprot:scaffold616_cov257-Pinguiococcus_pyrenoidosus.AAC.5
MGWWRLAICRIDLLLCSFCLLARGLPEKERRDLETDPFHHDVSMLINFGLRAALGRAAPCRSSGSHGSCLLALHLHAGGRGRRHLRDAEVAVGLGVLDLAVDLRVHAAGHGGHHAVHDAVNDLRAFLDADKVGIEASYPQLFHEDGQDVADAGQQDHAVGEADDADVHRVRVDVQHILSKS